MDVTSDIPSFNVSTYLLIAVAILLYFKCSTSNSNTSKYNLPPNPYGIFIPIRHLIEFAQQPHILFERLSKKHGGIFRFNVIGRKSVTLTNWASVKEMLKMEGSSSRASALFPLSNKFQSFFDLNGKQWEHRRKHALISLKALKKGKTTEKLITSQILDLLNNLDQTDLSKVLNIKTVIYRVTKNVGLWSICSKTLEPDHPVSVLIEDLNKQIVKLIQFRLISYLSKIPSVIFRLFSATFRESEKRVFDTLEFLKQEVEEHIETLDISNPKDFIDYALIELDKPGTSRINKIEDIVADSLLLLVGYTDTVLIALEWIFLFLAKNQDMQERMYQEILQEYGHNTSPNWHNRRNLPFTQAFITESLRFKTIIPVLSPRIATRDMKIQGFDVPKDTTIIISLYCAHMDPNVYKDPKTFNPTRFLTQDGATTLESEQHVVGFSYGNRNCPAIDVARMVTFLFVTSLVQKYIVSPPIGGVDIDEMGGCLEGVAKNPYVKLEKRDASVGVMGS